MRMKQDLVNFLGDNLESIVDDHLELWKDRYYRLTLKEVLYELHINYDYSADLEYISEALGRELSSNEQCYWINCFEKAVKTLFYKGGNYGW